MNERHDPTGLAHLDHPAICQGLFHPRPAWGPPPGPPAVVLAVPTSDGSMLDAVCHPAQGTGPAIIFFHGNGEIVDDYAPLAPIITALPATFIPVEYRGYGRASGRPTASSMIGDAHLAVAFIEQWLADRGWNGPIVIMGRSLGSASALAVAAASRRVAGVIIDSGFARDRELLLRLGIAPGVVNGLPELLFGNTRAIASITAPTLIIHGTEDRIIPVADAHLLHQRSGASDRHLVTIAGADHNSLWAVGAEPYLAAIGDFLRNRMNERLPAD